MRITDAHLFAAHRQFPTGTPNLSKGLASKSPAPSPPPPYTLHYKKIQLLKDSLFFGNTPVLSFFSLPHEKTVTQLSKRRHEAVTVWAYLYSHVI